jgi:hypothetical protein
MSTSQLPRRDTTPSGASPDVTVAGTEQAEEEPLHGAALNIPAPEAPEAYVPLLFQTPSASTPEESSEPFQNPLRRLDQIVWGTEPTDPQEVERLTREVFNIPEQYPVKLGGTPVAPGGSFYAAVRVGSYSHDYVTIQYTGDDLFLNAQPTPPAGVPEFLKQEQEMWIRINALFEA